MRTAPLALAYLDDELGLVQAASAVSELTHYDPDAGDACVLWCLAIRHAVLTGVLDGRIGLQHLGADRRELWARRLDAAEKSQPSDFRNNGWVVERCRRRGRRSRPRLSRKAIRQRESFASTTCARRSTQQCAVAGTPTPSPPSRADCSALHTGHLRFQRTGVVCCTAGRECALAISSNWLLRSPAEARPMA
jgi:hypothetical protein